MENGNHRQSFAGMYICLGIIIILQFINIATNILMPAGNANPKESVMKTGQLPDNINKEYREQLVSAFISSWNNRDIEALYNTMGKSARNQLPFETFKTQCEPLFNIGQIANIDYINHEYAGKYLGLDMVNLYFTASIGMQSGTLNFCILCSPDEPQVMRFDLKTNPL